MTTATYIKLKKELKKELLSELYTLVVRQATDPEGTYRPEFVKKILRISKQQKPYYKYDPKSFSRLMSS